MRFLLLERIEDIPEEYYKEWRTADSKRREVIVREVLQKMGDNASDRKSLTLLIDPFRTSCAKYSIDVTKNPFIKYFQQLVKNVKIEPKHASYLNTLVMMSESNASLFDRVKEAGNKNDSYLLNPSLFYRNEHDFIYTVMIFQNVLTPTKLKKYFKDTSNISVDQLYIGDKIKDAGDESTADDTNTIFGQVEAWAGEYGENNVGNDIDISLDDKKKSKDKQQSTTGKLTQAELKRIRDYGFKTGLRFSSLEDADRAGIKEGQVIYVDFKGDMVKNQGDPDNWIDTWMIKKNGKWQKYDLK